MKDVCTFSLKDKSLMPQFRAFGERDKAMTEKFKGMSPELVSAVANAISVKFTPSLLSFH